MRLFFFLIVLLYSVELAAAELNVEFRDISRQKGDILVGLYASAEAFEQAPATYYVNGALIADRGSLGASIRVNASTLTATFSDLEPGAMPSSLYMTLPETGDSTGCSASRWSPSPFIRKRRSISRPLPTPPSN